MNAKRYFISRFLAPWGIAIAFIQKTKSVMAWVMGLSLIASAAEGQTVHLHDEIVLRESIANTTFILTGRSELHLTGRGSDLLPGSEIHLDSPDAWLLFRYVAPSLVNTNYLGRVRVNGVAAARTVNVRVVQYGVGTVVIPHSPNYPVLEVFQQANFQGRTSLTFKANDRSEGLLSGRVNWNNTISSFRLKRGYMATFAVNADGSGFSRVYIAQDGDLEIGALPDDLTNQIQYVRVLPWRWVGKKGYAGGTEGAGAEPAGVRSAWFYNWNNNRSSSLNIEYTPIQQTRWWPSYSDTRNKLDVTHYLGFNEPDNPVEDAHQFTPTPQSAVNVWGELTRAGLRLGSPSTTDANRWWLYEFMDLADQANLRVDFTVVHFYRCGQSAASLYQYLREVHLRTGRPIWLKEFNNGANWTQCGRPTLEENATRIREWIQMMDATPWVERYSIYSWVESVRQVYLDGSLTPMGAMYRDQESPIGYRQELPAGIGARAHYLFDGNVRDESEFANHGMLVGSPTFVPAPFGRALVFDGQHDSIQVPPNVGNSPDFTFAAWVKWQGGGNWQRIFDFGDGDTTPGRQLGRYLFLTPRSGANTLRLTLRVDGIEQQLNAPALIPGQWTHVAVLIDGRRNLIRLFVDGELIAVDQVRLRPSEVTARYSYLGRSQFPNDPLFAGQMADVRILDYALPASEIVELAILPLGISYAEWAALFSFPEGRDGPQDDPSGDGVPNVVAFLLGADPLVFGSASLPSARVVGGGELGGEADPSKSYLSLQVRVKSELRDVTLTPQAAGTLEALAFPDASQLVREAGPPVADGDFEIRTFYFIHPIDDSPTGRGFMRLEVGVQGG